MTAGSVLAIRPPARLPAGLAAVSFAVPAPIPFTMPGRRPLPLSRCPRRPLPDIGNRVAATVFARETGPAKRLTPPGFFPGTCARGLSRIASFERDSAGRIRHRGKN